MLVKLNPQAIFKAHRGDIINFTIRTSSYQLLSFHQIENTNLKHAHHSEELEMETPTLGKKSKGLREGHIQNRKKSQW